SVGDDPARGFQAAQDLVTFLSPLLAHRKADPTNDLLSKLVHAEVEGPRLTALAQPALTHALFSNLVHAEVEGARLTDEEVLSFLRLLLPAGAETTYRLTGSCLYAMLAHREVYHEV